MSKNDNQQKNVENTLSVKNGGAIDTPKDAILDPLPPIANELKTLKESYGSTNTGVYWTPERENPHGVLAIGVRLGAERANGQKGVQGTLRFDCKGTEYSDLCLLACQAILYRGESGLPEGLFHNVELAKRKGDQYFRFENTIQLAECIAKAKAPKSDREKSISAIVAQCRESIEGAAEMRKAGFDSIDPFLVAIQGIMGLGKGGKIKITKAEFTESKDRLITLLSDLFDPSNAEKIAKVVESYAV